MSSKYVVDAGALALYFSGDKRIKKYFDNIFRGYAIGYLCEINLAEFYYKTAEKLGEEVAKLRYISIRNSSIRQIAAGGDLTIEAARIKLRYRRRISIADAYLIALARMVNGVILTTDKTVKEVYGKCIYFEV